MRRSHYNRPQDFKRRTLAIVTTSRADLYEEEQRWLSRIKESEIRSKYYNLCLSVKNLWHQDPEKRLTVGQKISHTKLSNPDKQRRGAHSEETKKLMSERKKGGSFTLEHRAKLAASKRGTVYSDERKAAISQRMKEQYADGRRTAKKKPILI